MALLILLIGLILQLPSGTFSRMQVHTAIPEMPYTKWYIMIFKSWSSIAAIAIWIFCRRTFSPERKKQTDIFGIAFIASWMIILILTFKFHFPQRAHWANDLLAMIFIMINIKDFYPSRKSQLTGIALIILYALWGSSLVYWQIRVNRAGNYCADELKKGNNIIVDYNNMYIAEIPFWLMGMVYYPWYNSLEMFVNGHSHNKIHNMIIVQGNNIGKTYRNWTKVPGNNDWYKASDNFYLRPTSTGIYHDCVSITAGAPSIATTPLNYMLSSFKDTVRVNGIYFQTSKIKVDNDTLELIKIFVNPIKLRGREIISIDY